MKKVTLWNNEDKQRRKRGAAQTTKFKMGEASKNQDHTEVA